MDRLDVFKVLIGERDYQDGKWGALHDKNESVAGFLTYMDVYLQRAKEALTDNAGDGAALDITAKSPHSV